MRLSRDRHGSNPTPRPGRRCGALAAALLGLAATTHAQTVQVVEGGFTWPLEARGSYSSGSQTIDATGEKFACIFKVPKTGTLDKFELYYDVTTAQTLRVSFQDVSTANGDPDGTQDQFRDIASPTSGWAVPGLITADGTDGGAKRTVTRGDLLAAVVEFASTAGNIVVRTVNPGSSNAQGTDLYVDLFTAAWAKNGTHGCNFALKYNDGSYEYLGGESYAISALATTTFASNSTPDERGIRFNVPWKLEVEGAWFIGDVDAAMDVVLYDSDGTTALRTTTLDSDIRASNGLSLNWVSFATPVTLNINTTYRLVLKPTTTTAVGVRELTSPSAAVMDAWPGGQGVHLTTRTDAGSWTETTTTRPMMGLRVSGVSDNVCAGGGAGVTCVVR